MYLKREEDEALIKAKKEEKTSSINSQLIADCTDNNISLNDISDSHHTFGELYDHRIAIFVALCNSLYEKDKAESKEHGYELPELRTWKSKQHHPDSDKMYEGWFIAGINQEKGEQITYHMPIKYWDYIRSPEVGHSPLFDGHTSDDVLERLLKI